MGHRTIGFLVSLGAIAALAGCHGTGAPCASSSDCGKAGVCTPAKFCATACASSATCAGDQTCNTAAGACVSKINGCVAPSDCTGGLVCNGGTCGQPLPVDPRSGAGGGDGTPSNNCGAELFAASHVQSNMLIVLDSSGSMNEAITGGTKWEIATAALKRVTAANDTKIRFGLNTFSTDVMKCDIGSNKVPVGDATASLIASYMPVKAPGNGTPIGGALHLAATNAALADTSRANYVMLVTDGKENCNGKPVDEVKALFAKNVKTFVVGFGADVDKVMLANMATEGGTARAGTVKYYQADDGATLNAAFDSIAQGAIGCNYKLAKAPPDPTKIFVSVGGQLAPHDASRMNGWEYDAAQNRITLYGATCEQVSKNPGTKVNIVYGCPDPGLIEGGTGGGGGSTGAGGAGGSSGAGGGSGGGSGAGGSPGGLG